MSTARPIPHTPTFITHLTALQGAGVGLVQFAIFAILSDAFPKKRGLLIGSATTMIALGYFVGPPIGGGLFMLSGFRLPFLTLSLLVLMVTLPTLSLFSSLPTARTRDGGAQEMISHSTPPSESVAYASSDLPLQPSGECDPRSPAPAGENKDASWRRLAASMPFDVWLLCVAALVYNGKWAWWDIYFTSWVVDEFKLSVGGASLYVSLIAGASC